MRSQQQDALALVVLVDNAFALNRSPAMTQRAKEMLELADKIAAFTPSSKGPIVLIARERRLIEDALRLAAQADAPGGEPDVPSSAEPACGDYSQTSQHRSGDLRPGSAGSAPGGLDAATIDNVPSCGQENDYRRAQPQETRLAELSTCLRETREQLIKLRRAIHESGALNNRDKYLNLGIDTNKAIDRAWDVLNTAPQLPQQGVRERLEKIACRHVTENPLWWQIEAREALAALSEGKPGGEIYCSVDGPQWCEDRPEASRCDDCPVTRPDGGGA
jgi:hypothetical protein